MNKRISRNQDGGAIIMAMLFAFIAIAMTGAYLGYTGRKRTPACARSIIRKPRWRPRRRSNTASSNCAT